MLYNLFPPHFYLTLTKTCGSHSLLPNHAFLFGSNYPWPQCGKIDKLYFPTGEIEVSSINILIIRENKVKKKEKNSGLPNGSYEFHCILNAPLVHSV